jgi:adenylate kinase family enzyme
MFYIFGGLPGTGKSTLARQLAQKLIEVSCSDQQEHQRRVELRTGDISGYIPPTWTAVLAREYHSWAEDHIILDTVGQTPAQSFERLQYLLMDKYGQNINN